MHTCNNWPLPLLLKMLHLQPFSNCVQCCLCLSVTDIFLVPCSQSELILVLHFLDSKMFYDIKRDFQSHLTYTQQQMVTLSDHYYEIF